MKSGLIFLLQVFYLLSRYEEYLPHKKDAYGRYDYENSLAFKEGFLNLPLVNTWLEDFRFILADKNPAFNNSKRNFEFVPTYDIDIAWSYRNKGFKRNFVGIALLIAGLKFGKAVERIRVLKGKNKDPFDAYEWMDVLHEKYKPDPVYFLLLAKENSRYDKNIDPENPEFRQLMKELSVKYRVGIHPSWNSGDHPELIRREKRFLETITGKTIELSRQHYIRFQFPFTFQKLIDAGITNDYSMGYGSINGFRASFAGSFYWYDLKNDSPTKLLLHPFCFMDANSYYEQRFSPEEALNEMRHYKDVIKAVGGRMITIWHNSFLGTAKEFAGWRDVYEQFVSEVNEE